MRVAQACEESVTLEQIAADFGIHPMTLQKLIRKADVEAGFNPGTTAAESQELRETKRLVRLLELSEVLRRAACPRRICREKGPFRNQNRTSPQHLKESR